MSFMAWYLISVAVAIAFNVMSSYIDYRNGHSHTWGDVGAMAICSLIPFANLILSTMFVLMVIMPILSKVAIKGKGRS